MKKSINFRKGPFSQPSPFLNSLDLRRLICRELFSRFLSLSCSFFLFLCLFLSTAFYLFSFIYFPLHFGSEEKEENRAIFWSSRKANEQSFSRRIGQWHETNELSDGKIPFQGKVFVFDAAAFKNSKGKKQIKRRKSSFELNSVRFKVTLLILIFRINFIFATLCTSTCTV